MSSLDALLWSIRLSIRPFWLAPGRNHVGIIFSHFPFSSPDMPEEPTPPSPVSAPSTPPSPVSDPSSIQLPQLSDESLPTSVSPILLSTLTRDEITRLVHHEGSTYPPIRPCDRANGSDTKTHWTSEDLHRALGCRRFRNYKHILQTSLDGQWIDGGEFPLALGSYATIPKA